MRIVHLSDIHLSIDNFNEFQDNYKDALIADIKKYNESKAVDLIIITGDLVDKGGYSLFKIPGFESFKCPYEIFENIFLTPISTQTGIEKNRFLFIPGNHDIDEREILWFDECEMTKNINHNTVEEYRLENKLNFTYNDRIKKFKSFEKKYHDKTPFYNFSYNESTFIYTFNEYKIGFILVNDSWRCKTVKFDLESEKDGKHYFGHRQLYDGLKEIENTSLNVCLFHHSTNNFKEQIEVERFLQNNKIEFFLYGHYHNAKFEKLYSPFGNCQGIRGRAALFKPNEKIEEYQSGYQIIDLDLKSYKITRIHYRKYIYSGCRFDSDTNTAPNGIDNGTHGKGIELVRNNRGAISFNLNKADFKK